MFAVFRTGPAGEILVARSEDRAELRVADLSLVRGAMAERPRNQEKLTPASQKRKF